MQRQADPGKEEDCQQNLKKEISQRSHTILINANKNVHAHKD